MCILVLVLVVAVGMDIEGVMLTPKPVTRTWMSSSWGGTGCPGRETGSSREEEAPKSPIVSRWQGILCQLSVYKLVV